MVKKILARLDLGSFALCAMVLFALILQGCNRDSAESKKQELPSNSPEVYMNDPVFRQQLEEKRKELQAIVKERAPLEARMKELIKEHGKDLAALQKIPEWNDLHKKITSLNARYEGVHQRQLRIAAKKLNPAKGGASAGDAKEISK